MNRKVDKVQEKFRIIDDLSRIFDEDFRFFNKRLLYFLLSSLLYV